MEYKTLGNTGLLVSHLCLGTMTFHGGEGFWKAIGTVDQAGADALVKASLDAGINFFDTADVYSEGESEKSIGQALKNLNIARKDVVIATKVFGRVGPGRNDVGASRVKVAQNLDRASEPAFDVVHDRALALGFEVAPARFMVAGNARDPLRDDDSGGFQRAHLVGIVRQQPDGADSQMPEDRARKLVAAEVALEFDR